MRLQSFAKDIDTITFPNIKYSICTLVTQEKEYSEMVESFINAGFQESFCEFLYVNNTDKNRYDAYKGLNKFLLEAKGQYIILCHQDILLLHDNIKVLERRILELDVLDTSWGIISNAGAMNLLKVSIRLTESDGKDHNTGSFPTKVKSVDENFILVKREANLALSYNLSGFHLYGTDLCLLASTLGYNAYVVDFNLVHKSKGNPDHNFESIKQALIYKYASAFKGIFIRTTITKFYISNSKLKNRIFNLWFIIYLVRVFYKIKAWIQNDAKHD